jgi:hypothetical protein
MRSRQLMCRCAVIAATNPGWRSPARAAVGRLQTGARGAVDIAGSRPQFSRLKTLSNQPGTHHEASAAPMMCIGIPKKWGITEVKHHRIHLRIGVALPLLAAIALASITAIRSSDSLAGVPTYSIGYRIISAGGDSLRNSCFGVSGTVGQVAPGYSNESSGGTTVSVYTGFWPAAPATGLDEIFFTGFEGC